VVILKVEVEGADIYEI